jgi:hypothetical protein
VAAAVRHETNPQFLTVIFTTFKTRPYQGFSWLIHLSVLPYFTTFNQSISYNQVTTIPLIETFNPHPYSFVRKAHFLWLIG